jgi:hypothetical protein
METKKKYNSPGIEIIYLDNEISLQLESTPPVGPTENYTEKSHCFENDPYKIIIS